MATKPNIKGFKRQQDRRLETFVETQVAPYLVSLLNTAQAKTRHSLAFSEGMGTRSFDVNGDSDHRISNILYRDNERERRYKILSARFPELIEFMKIVDFVLDERDGLNYCLGEIDPTVPPKPRHVIHEPRNTK